jgi:hypothetical protein
MRVPAAVAAEAAVVAQSVMGGFCHSLPDDPAEPKGGGAAFVGLSPGLPP